MTTHHYGPEWSASLRRADPDSVAAWLDFALECCDVADQLALAAFRSELEVQQKPDGSFVTGADRAIEQLVRSRLADRFPGHGIVGEEYGADTGGTDTHWFLDPIDGTHSFMRGIPLFATLMAVERDGEVQAGVISAPALGQRWWASRGGGAWTAGGALQERRPLRVSDEPSIARSQMLYRSVSDMHASRVSRGFDSLLPIVWRERGYGDFWGYALVASGAAEAMIEQDLGPWDTAAPWIVVEEAGGRVTDFDGRRSRESGESLATNGRLHDEFLDGLWSRREGGVDSPAR